MNHTVDAEDRIDVLVNNAGINRQGPIDTVTEEDWDEIMAVNLKGPFLVSQEVLPLIVEAFGQLPGFEDCDTGGLADDLKQMLRRYLEVFNSTALSAVLPSLAGERFHNPELSVLFEPVSMERRRPLLAAFERARERGEIPDDVDLELAADLVVGPIAVTLFFKGGRIKPEMVGPMVDLALRGIGAG